MFHSTMWLVLDDSQLHWYEEIPLELPDEDSGVQWQRRMAIAIDAGRQTGFTFEKHDFGERHGMLLVSVNRCHNHAASAPAEEIKFFELIGQRAPSSYGVWYLISDEPGPCFGRYVTIKLAGGRVEVSEDPFLKAHLPPMSE